MVEARKGERDWSKTFGFALAEVRLLLFWLSLPFFSLFSATALSFTLPLPRVLDAGATASSFSVHKHTHTQNAIMNDTDIMMNIFNVEITLYFWFINWRLLLHGS